MVRISDALGARSEPVHLMVDVAEGLTRSSDTQMLLLARPALPRPEPPPSPRPAPSPPHPIPRLQSALPRRPIPIAERLWRRYL